MRVFFSVYLGFDFDALLEECLFDYNKYKRIHAVDILAITIVLLSDRTEGYVSVILLINIVIVNKSKWSPDNI
jgi:hypothetical protein